MSTKDKLSQAINEIRVADSVVVLGAGVSFEAGMPLSGQLAPLVWHTLDTRANVRQRVATRLKLADNSAKSLVGDDPSALSVAFAEIANDRTSRVTFQDVFRELNQRRCRDRSRAHEALARLVYAGRVARVVSLNWDTLLEASFQHRYGAAINAQGRVLWKPHGDCDRNDEWVLPHDDGHIPDEIVQDMDSLVRERPRTLLIVGYSERDERVVRHLVDPLAARWRVFRVAPDATGEGSIGMSATEGIEAIANALAPTPETPGWVFVSFDGQRSIEAAISGERLGPKDVDSCPRLPHYESALKAVETVNFVDIAGQSGCGKSITAWQIARTLNRAGWQVLRRKSPDPDEDDMAFELDPIPWTV